MRILDTYYREGAPSAVAVSMSAECRSTTLNYKASSAYIFDSARTEMLQIMGVEVEPRPLVSVRVRLSHSFMSEPLLRCVVFWDTSRVVI